ncbi:hypothetical protein ACTXT7_006643 [Hymenolepis weldensis]
MFSNLTSVTNQLFYNPNLDRFCLISYKRCQLSINERPENARILFIIGFRGFVFFDYCNNVRDLSGPHRSNRWNKSSHSCRQISSEVAGKPPQFFNK